jgi:hypothetical protein
MPYKQRLLNDAAIRIKAGLIQPGKTTVVRVAHDDWCAIYNGGECNCDPDISYHELEGYDWGNNDA